jgi:hypothetical protein
MTNCQGPAYLSSCGDGGWVAEDGGFGGPIAYQDLAGPFPSESWFVGAVSGLAVVLVGVALARFHGRRAFELADAPGFRESPGRRPYEFYLYTTAFIAILVLAGAVAGAVRALVGVALPGSFRYDSLLGSLGLLISFAAVALGAWFVFRRHWRRIEVLRAPAGGEPSP